MYLNFKTVLVLKFINLTEEKRALNVSFSEKKAFDFSGLKKSKYPRLKSTSKRLPTRIVESPLTCISAVLLTSPVLFETTFLLSVLFSISNQIFSNLQIRSINTTDLTEIPNYSLTFKQLICEKDIFADKFSSNKPTWISQFS